MFGMDADLLNAAVSGSSLTYQNVGQRLDNFIRTTLAPNYLEPIEHGISERLTRTTVGRFNLQALLRADVKTQADVYSTLITAGLSSSRQERLLVLIHWWTQCRFLHPNLCGLRYHLTDAISFDCSALRLR